MPKISFAGSAKTQLSTSRSPSSIACTLFAGTQHHTGGSIHSSISRPYAASSDAMKTNSNGCVPIIKCLKNVRQNEASKAGNHGGMTSFAEVVLSKRAAAERKRCRRCSRLYSSKHCPYFCLGDWFFSSFRSKLPQRGKISGRGLVSCGDSFPPTTLPIQ